MAAIAGFGRAEVHGPALTRPATPAAAAELYERHAGRVFGFCLSRLGRREDAEDAAQLTFLHAVRGLRRGIVPVSETAWLFAIARNVCLSRWASASRRSRVEAACDPTELERLAFADDPRRDELIGLERALAQLPVQQRRAVLLRDWRGLSYEEIGAELGVTRSAVEALIFRGRAALAEHLVERPHGRVRPLRSLTEVGSLLHTAKGLLAWAAGAKVAGAVTAVVAVSVGGLALGPAGSRMPSVSPAQAPGLAERAAAEDVAFDHHVPRAALAGAPAPERVAAVPATLAPARAVPPAPAAAVELPPGATPSPPESVFPPSDRPTTDPVAAVVDPVVAVADPVVAVADPAVSVTAAAVAATDPAVAVVEGAVAGVPPPPTLPAPPPQMPAAAEIATLRP